MIKIFASALIAFTLVCHSGFAQEIQGADSRLAMLVYSSGFQGGDWDTGESQDFAGKVVGTGYRLESRLPENFYAVWKNLSDVGGEGLHLAELDFDLSIRVSLLNYQGVSGSYGLIWGNSDPVEDYYYVGVSSQGRQVFNFRRQGEQGPNEWGDSYGFAFRSTGEENEVIPANTLKLSRRGNAFQYYINDQLVREGAYPGFPSSDNFGFYSYGLTTILVEQISMEVYQ